MILKMLLQWKARPISSRNPVSPSVWHFDRAIAFVFIPNLIDLYQNNAGVVVNMNVKLIFYHQQHGVTWHQFWMFLCKITKNQCTLLQFSNISLVAKYSTAMWDNKVSFELLMVKIDHMLTKLNDLLWNTLLKCDEFVQTTCK